MGSEPELDRLVLFRLAEQVGPERAVAVLEAALEAEQLDEVPRNAWVLRQFVDGALRQAAGEALEGFEPIFEEAGRRLPSSRPPTPFPDARVLVLSIDRNLVAALRGRLGPRSSITRTDSLFGLSPLTEIGGVFSSALVVDVPLSPIPIPSLARTSRLIPRECQLWLVGVRDEDRERVANLFARFDACHVCGSVEEIDFRPERFRA